MLFGVFFISFVVKDFVVLIKFYEIFGFESFYDGSEYNYVIFKSGEVVIGLF